MVWLPAHRRTAGDLAVRSLDKVSPSSDQLYSWGGAEGPLAPLHLPNGGGLGRRSRPKPPPKSVKFARTLSNASNDLDRLAEHLLKQTRAPVSVPNLYSRVAD